MRRGCGKPGLRVRDTRAPLCGSGSPAPRLARFAGVGEPPDRSHKTLTSFGATSTRSLGTDGRAWPGSSSTGRGRARRNRHGDLNAGRLDPEKRHTRSRAARRRQLPTEPRHDARPNKPGPHRRPAARHDAAPETFPRTTPFDVGARSPRTLEATIASPSAPGHPDLSRGRLRLVDAIRQDVKEGRPKAALFVLLRRAQNATHCQCRRAGRRSSRPGRR